MTNSIIAQYQGKQINIDLTHFKDTGWLRPDGEYRLSRFWEYANHSGVKEAILKKLAKEGEIPSISIRGETFLITLVPRCPTCNPYEPPKLDFSQNEIWKKHHPIEAASVPGE